MVLSDTSINALCEDHGVITPFNPDLLSVCSYDLTLGNTIKVESLDPHNDGWVEVDITDGYLIQPKQFILAHTAETIRLPRDVSGQIVLRSSAARLGWNHCLAGWCDPSFHGQVTLELKNQLQLHPLTIQAGQRLVQMIFFKLDRTPAAGYDQVGNYQHQTGVTVSNNNVQPLV